MIITKVRDCYRNFNTSDAFSSLGNTPSRNIVDDVSSGASYSNSTMTSSSKHTQYYNYPQSGGGGGGSHSTAYSSSASSSTATTASSFYTQTTTSKSISNRHEEKRLETCSYQETEMVSVRRFWYEGVF